jgi:hypothetical protein
MLEFRAVYLDNHAGIAEQNLGSCFNDARFARAGRSKEQQIAHGAPWRVQSRTKYLVKIDESLYTLLLANDLGAQSLVEVARIVAADAGIQLLPCCCFHGVYPLQ